MLKGVFRVHYNGDYRFNVKCEVSGDNAPKNGPKANESWTPLVFTQLPRDGEDKVEEWAEIMFGGSIDIEQWGKPYDSFTCCVDGYAYLAVRDSPDQICWVCCRDGDDLCIWTRKKNATSQKKRAHPSKPKSVKSIKPMKEARSDMRSKAMKSKPRKRAK